MKPKQASPENFHRREQIKNMATNLAKVGNNIISWFGRLFSALFYVTTQYFATHAASHMFP